LHLACWESAAECFALGDITPACPLNDALPTVCKAAKRAAMTNLLLFHYTKKPGLRKASPGKRVRKNLAASPMRINRADKAPACSG